jgi:hypothetical protein
MANFTIKGHKQSVINMDQSDSTWNITTSATITVKNNSAVFEDSDQSGNTLINNGHVFADNGEHTITVYLDGEGTSFTNTTTGVINGLTGVRMGGDHQTMVNQGLIDVSEEGLKIYGTGSQAENNGKIFADGTGVDLINCDGSVFTNGDHGKIKSSGGTGVSFATDAQVTVRFVNDGVVSSKFDAVSGSDGNDKVVNHGKLVGDVNLGGGNDMFDMRKGTFDGSFVAGDGNDVIRGFTAGDDNHVIDLTFHHDIADINDLIANHVMESNGGTVIFYDGGRINLIGAEVSDLHEANFIFF